jgi:hypothetical protein
MLPDGKYQTKSTPAQYMDTYEIRADGSLWHEAYDWDVRNNPNATGFNKVTMTRTNQRWEPCHFFGCITFYDDYHDYVAYVVDGVAILIREIIAHGSRIVWEK